MALKLKGSTSGFVAIDAPSVAGNNTLILPENTGSAHQILANDITAGVTTFTQVTVSRNGDLTVPGTISIGGTLTYEDVTSVDSIGIVTARGLSIFGNTSGLNVTGVSTFGGNVNASSSVYVQGNPAEVRIQHTGNGSYSRLISDSDNALNIYTGGGPSLGAKIDSSGRLLLGTTTEGVGGADELTINTASGHGGMTIRNDTSSNGNIFFSDGTSGAAEYAGYVQYAHNGDHMVFGTSGGERLRITSGGTVNIGGDYSNTTGILKVTGKASIEDTGGDVLTLRSTTASSRTTIKLNTNGNDWELGARGSSGNPNNSFYLYDEASTAYRVVIDSNGLMGLGIANPTSHNNTTALQIYDDYNSQGYPRIRLTNQSTGTTTADGFEITLDGSNLDAIFRQRENADIHFYTNNAVKAVIDSSGQLGIGLVSPGSPLHAYHATTNTIAQFQSGDAGAGILLKDSTHSTRLESTNGTFKIDVDASQEIGSEIISFQMNNSEKLRITTDGYVHLGQSIGTNQVGGQSVTGQDFDPVFKIYNNVSNKWLMQLRQDTSTGPNGIFMRAGSNANNYTMYLTGNDEHDKHLVVRGDGRTGIGTDNPDERLEVNGNAKFNKDGDVNGAAMGIYPLGDITLANNASATLALGSRFTGIVIVAGYQNDTAAAVFAVASASSYSSDSATRLHFQTHSASNTTDLTISSPSHGGTHQFQLNQSGSSTKTYKVIAFGIHGG